VDIIILLIIMALTYYIVQQARLETNEQEKTSQRGRTHTTTRPIVYLSRGALFCRTEYDELEPLHDEQPNDSTPPMQCTAVAFVGEKILRYFLSDKTVGGVFEYDLRNGMKKRLLAEQNLHLTDFRYDPVKNRLLCASGDPLLQQNVAALDCNANELIEFTDGDSIDAAPTNFPAQPENLVVQRSGTARIGDQSTTDIGPASIHVLCPDSKEMETVVAHDEFDYLRPRVHPSGDLFYIRRPYRGLPVSVWKELQDLFAFPQAGTPSLAPNSWQLIRRNRYGQEMAVARNVVSFDIASDGEIVYTNGFGVFRVTESENELLFTDTMIETVVVP